MEVNTVLPGCGSRVLSAPVPEAAPLLLPSADVESEDTLHRVLLQSWRRLQGACAPATDMP